MQLTQTIKDDIFIKTVNPSQIKYFWADDDKRIRIFFSAKEILQVDNSRENWQALNLYFRPNTIIKG